ncbi:hypothetical protein LPW11_18775 [Geomonas sp. RF6]|uniref:hypothetical protein n=1 Tax=Geomonas sp. RF6 TaxID=2897342 RepID=UPI001E4F5E07|nr:hypothetical protein [Geomonas sp. RF6]UFS69918.1 hypothetical protein LPW11_18775 [Geomonas sp. RF6]
MPLVIKPSDLKYRYPRVVETRDLPKFRGKPDDAPFNRNDLYEVLPVLEAVMDDLRRDDADTLHLLEDLMNQDLPRFIATRGEVFDFLSNCARDSLAADL